MATRNATSLPTKPSIELLPLLLEAKGSSLGGSVPWIKLTSFYGFTRLLCMTIVWLYCFIISNGTYRFIHNVAQGLQEYDYRRSLKNLYVQIYELLWKPALQVVDVIA